MLRRFYFAISLFSFEKLIIGTKSQVRIPKSATVFASITYDFSIYLTFELTSLSQNVCIWGWIGYNKGRTSDGSSKTTKEALYVFEKSCLTSAPPPNNSPLGRRELVNQTLSQDIE